MDIKVDNEDLYYLNEFDNVDTEHIFERDAFGEYMSEQPELGSENKTLVIPLVIFVPMVVHRLDPLSCDIGHPMYHSSIQMYMHVMYDYFYKMEKNINTISPRLIAFSTLPKEKINTSYLKINPIIDTVIKTQYYDIKIKFYASLRFMIDNDNKVYEYTNFTKYINKNNYFLDIDTMQKILYIKRWFDDWDSKLVRYKPECSINIKEHLI